LKVNFAVKGFFIVLFVSFSGVVFAQAVSLDDVTVRTQIGDGLKSLQLVAAAPVEMTVEGANDILPAGAYTVTFTKGTPVGVRYQLFVKTFLPGQAAAADQHVAEWKAKGYEAQIVIFGRQYATEAGGVVDNRSLWVSVGRYPSEAAANAVKVKLQKESVWGWVWKERTGGGAGTYGVLDASGKRRASGKSLQLAGSGGIEVKGVDTGYWKSRKTALRLAGTLEFGVGTDGLMEVYETARLEDYVAGVLPAEMPAEWPKEALKAQAVAARSEVLANLSGKHMLEGFDFCATEHCRAYQGAGGRTVATDAATAETRHVAMTYQGRFLPAVFCANCGGWTEDNEAVWSGPANGGLRAVADFGEGKAPAAPKGTDAGVRQLLRGAKGAYCGQMPNYRWTREFSRDELTVLVNKRHPVGRVQRVELGERGQGGRLKWVRVHGAKGTQMIQKELNIRGIFGGLPSALFIIEESAERVRLTGGGRGHGVGLCQDGARGMAVAGIGYREIVSHYFPNAALVSLAGK